jgi:hypothetical protein
MILEYQGAEKLQPAMSLAYVATEIPKAWDDRLPGHVGAASRETSFMRPLYVNRLRLGDCNKPLDSPQCGAFGAALT